MVDMQIVWQYGRHANCETLALKFGFMPPNVCIGNRRLSQPGKCVWLWSMLVEFVYWEVCAGAVPLQCVCVQFQTAPLYIPKCACFGVPPSGAKS